MCNGFVVGKHPEIKDNEFLLSNVKIGEEWIFGFFNGKGKNGRLGKIAYDNMGYIVNNFRPVFVRMDGRFKK